MIAAALLACRDDGDPLGTPGPGEWPDYDVLAYVDPTMATGGDGAQVTGLNPGAAWPLGQVLVGPDTRSSVFGQLSFMHYGGYHADDDLVESFSHTHGSGMGIVDYGAVPVFPRVGPFDPAWMDPVARASTFTDETASAGEYHVTLDDGTTVSIAASAHGAVHRWTFPAGVEPVVLLDLAHVLPGVDVDAGSWAEIDGAHVTGLHHVAGGYSDRFGGIRTSFAGDFAPAPAAVVSWSPYGVDVDGVRAGADGGLALTFPAGTTEVELRLAVSVVDVDGAEANLAAELLPSYDDVSAAARGAWSTWLGRAKIWGGPDEAVSRRIFHTSHYRAGLMPRTYSDVDGRYRGVDGAVHDAAFRYLSDLSLWDTYRTSHPWYALVQPEAQRDAAASLTRMAEDGGVLPRWPMAHGYTGGMIGSPASIVLAETVQKGLTDGWDPQAALPYVVAQSDGPTSPVGRGCVEDWVALGYVPSECGGSVSLSVEYAWADAAGAAMADALGHPDEAARLAERSRGWEPLWDPEVGFLHGRTRAGDRAPFVAPDVWTDELVEGNAWHYLWQTPWDVPRMIDVMHDGDVDAFAARSEAYWDDVAAEADTALPDVYYWHGNEPVMHYAWLGSLAGRPEITVRAVDWVASHRYSDGLDGLDGNDDAGTLSAWYLWATLGVYPIAGTTMYAVGAPRVEHAELDTPSGLVVFDAPGAADGPFVPSAVEVDGEVLDGWVVDHADLVGATLSFRP